MVTRRQFLQAASVAPAAALMAVRAPESAAADYAITIAPYSLEVSPRRLIKTIAYNSQVPGPLLRFREGQPVTIDVTNRTSNPEVVHWHGLFLPSHVDGAIEEGTPPIPPGGSARYTFTPRPAGFRWYHTHVFAGRDFNKGQYTGQHGFLWIEPRENPARYDAEMFLALHDWRGQLLASDDGSMNPYYDVSTINGRVLGFGEPLRVKAGQRLLLHLLNSSATDCHWIAMAGHEFQVIALDGNPVPNPNSVPMLRLAPAERVSAIVQLNNPGAWVLGEVRKHIRAAGMGIVVEYANRGGEPEWRQPEILSWDYQRFESTEPSASEDTGAAEIPLVFKSKFTGHGDMDHWMINGKSFPHTDTVELKQGQRYRLQFKNESTDHHPVHLHRHTFELRSLSGRKTRGIVKDTVLVKSNTQVDVEFTANDPGLTLFHCHQQDHMDMGFMMLFHYV
ncbi:MAG TPA: multicopper oxidase domain-containing protein [Bryobacteraceae bacterium]|nr:multicopper oxidase domain-containing protein [Bryobacteraceae bacterium]